MSSVSTGASRINANNLLSQAQIEEMIFNHALSIENKRIIDELISGKIPYNVDTIKLLEDLDNSVIKTKANLTLALSTGATEIVGLSGSSMFAAGTYAAAVSAGIFGVAATAAAYGALSVYINLNNLCRDDQKRLMKISNETFDSFKSIFDCFKEEDHPGKRPSNGEIDILYFLKNMTSIRNSPLFNAWRDKRKLQIEYIENNNIGGNAEYQEKLKKYEQEINKRIKPEFIFNGKFDKYMQIFCAGNKVLWDAEYVDPERKKRLSGGHYKEALEELSGEFTNTKLKKTTEQSWYTIDGFSEHAKGLIKDNIFTTGFAKFFGTEYKKPKSPSAQTISDSISKMLKDPSKFDEMESLFYGSHRALTYAQKIGIQKIEFKRNEKKDGKIVEIKEMIDIKTYTARKFDAFLEKELKDHDLNKSEFSARFLEYRYLQGECEFDAHEFFELKFAHPSKTILLSESIEAKQYNAKFGKYLLETAVTVATGAAIGTLSYYTHGAGIREDLLKKKSAKIVSEQSKLIPKSHPDFNGELSKLLKPFEDSLSLQDKLKYNIGDAVNINEKLKTFLADNPLELLKLEPNFELDRYVEIPELINLQDPANSNHWMYEIFCKGSWNDLNYTDLRMNHTKTEVEYLGKVLKAVGYDAPWVSDDYKIPLLMELTDNHFANDRKEFLLTTFTQMRQNAEWRDFENRVDGNRF